MLKILISLALSVFLGSISYSPKYITTQMKFVQHDILFSVTTQLIPGSYAINVFNFKTNQWDVLQSNIPAQNNQNQALRAYLTKDNVNDYISDEKKIKVQLTSTKKENFDRVLTFAVNHAEFILYR